MRHIKKKFFKMCGYWSFSEPICKRSSEIKKYRETRRGAAIPIDDEERLDILENFIEIFENNELDSVLISSLQSILEVEGCSEII